MYGNNPIKKGSMSYVRKLKDIARAGLYSSPQNLDEISREKMAYEFGVDPEEITVAHVIMHNQLIKAREGDKDAIAYVTLMAGEKPSDKIVVAEIGVEVQAKMEQLVQNTTSPYENEIIDVEVTESE